MKKIVINIAVVVLMSFYVSAQTLIGKVTNGEATITIKPTDLKQKWENHLQTQGKSEISLSNFRILKFNDQYLLVSDDIIRDGKQSKFAIALEKKDNLCYASGYSVECTGCSEGCEPAGSVGNFYCTPCSWPNSTCTQKSTISGSNVAVF